MMRIAIVIATTASVGLLPTGPARADFVLGGAKPAGAAPVPMQAAPPAAEVPAEKPEQAAPRFKVARGFGEAVPMSFAVRQIVPAAVRVHYGPGIDPDTLVSWKGNRPWNQALAAAVRPLHLRIVTGTDTVLITR